VREYGGLAAAWVRCWRRKCPVTGRRVVAAVQLAVAVEREQAPTASKMCEP
jgi:hypothetical protein